jgi:flagellar protein FlbD
MIQLHRLNGKPLVVNSDNIKFIESTPDTLLTLMTSDEKLMVKESVNEVIEKVIEYKRQWLWKPLEEQRKA